MASTLLYIFCVLAVRLLYLRRFFIPSFSYDYVASILLSLVIAYSVAFGLVRRYASRWVTPAGKAIFITGCDSGFGHQLAKRLHNRGYNVFAGCLFPSGYGAESLKQFPSNRLHVLGLDVTSDDSVQKALKYVRNNLNDSELWAVVNNAGVYKGYDIAWTSLEDFRSCYEVNSLGVVRVTKAFLPLLLKARGRVVTVTSMAGHVSFPGISAYSMSKFAASAFCDSLRQEVEPMGVKVVEVAPEAFRTPMTDWECHEKTFDEMVMRNATEVGAAYGDEFWRRYKLHLKTCSNLCSPLIHKVMESLEEAVSLSEPYPVYRPCRSYLVSIAVHLAENMPKALLGALIQFGRRMAGYPTFDGTCRISG